MTTKADVATLRRRVAAMSGAPPPAPVKSARELLEARILDVLPMDDRGRPFDPALAKADTVYSGRNKDILHEYLKRHDTARVASKVEASKEQQRARLAEITVRREARAEFEATAQAAADAAEAQRIAAKWQEPG